MNAISSLNREDAYSAVEPYINAEGVHLWPFDPLFPLDVHSFTLDGPGNIRMNRHDYFELGLVLSGEAIFQIQERSLPVREGDLLVMGSNLYHTLRRIPRRKFEAVFFCFQPGLVRAAESSGDDTEKPLSEISQETGFCDQSYFGRVIREIAQTTPAAYRRRFGKSSLGGSIHC